MSSSSAPPDFASLVVRGFLGFPSHSGAAPISLDGDIVMLTGANGAGKSSLMEAIAFRETGGFCRRSFDQLIYRGPESEGRFHLQFDSLPPIIGDDKGVQNPPSWWADKLEKDRQRHVRTVYLLPAYLDKLFEEHPDATESSFIDLLAPPSPAVDALRVALRDGIKAVEEEISRVESESQFISEEEKNKVRRERVAAFNAQTASWLESDPNARKWLGGFSAERLVIRSGNLRSTWIGELANIASEFLSRVGGVAQELSVSDVSRPSEALRVLAAAARLSVVRASSMLGAQNDASRASMSADLAAGIAALPESAWALLRQSNESRHAEQFAADFAEKNLVEKRDAVRRIRNALGRGESNFIDWIAELQQRTRIWDELFSKVKQPVTPPEVLVDWCHTAGELVNAWSSCEPHWREWATQVEDREKQLSYELDQLQASTQLRRKVRALSEALSKIFSTREDLRTIFQRADSVSDFLAETEKIENTIRAGGAKLISSTEGVEPFARACDSWAEWERKVEADEERQQGPEASAFLKKLERLRELQTAIKSETGTSSKGRIGQLQQEALGAVLKPMEDFLNESAGRFRIFENITPVRLERFSSKKDGNRLGPRVGNPEREIGQTSNGQRNQLGFLTLLALHFGLRTTYNSRVLCLDEITSSFDLSQIPRLALLLRQIAYATADSEFQRRIFIAGHNEEFNQRLAELLTPPDGRKLRIIRFTGYSKAGGPTMESQLMQPSLKFDSERLRNYFHHRYCAGR
jgi:hypothetical protein